MGFADSVGLTTRKMQQEVNENVLKISTELFTSVVDKTPVSSPKYVKRGELINNWFVGQGDKQINRSYTSLKSLTGNSSRIQIATLRNSTEFLGKDGEVSLTNSVSYGYRAEYAGWPAPRWKNTRPYAMIRNSLTLVASKYKK